MTFRKPEFLFIHSFIHSFIHLYIYIYSQLLDFTKATILYSPFCIFSSLNSIYWNHYEAVGFQFYGRCRNPRSLKYGASGAARPQWAVICIHILAALAVGQSCRSERWAACFQMEQWWWWPSWTRDFPHFPGLLSLRNIVHSKQKDMRQ